MIPLSLTVRGLLSYRLPQTIDFTPLLRAGIFGIFGAVGSGKSTIVDAMSIALFGESDRTSGRGSRRHDLINLRSNDFKVEFIFRASGREFRAVAEASRTADTKGAKPHRSAWVRDREEWRQVPTDEMMKALKLSHDVFRKAVVIPQGRFQEFLTMRQEDRLRMMTALFRLEQYDLGPFISRIERQAAEELRKIEGQLDGLKDVSEEAIKRKSHILDNAEATILAAEADLARADDRERRGARMYDLKKNIAQMQARLRSLEDKEPEYQRRAADIKAYELASATFSPLIEAQIAAERRFSNAELQHGAVLRTVQEAELELEIALRERASLPKMSGKVDQHAELADMVEQLHKARLLEERHLKSQRQLLERAKALKAMEHRQAELTVQLADVDASLQQERAKLASLDDVVSALEWFRRRDELDAQRQKVEQEHVRIRDMQETLKSEKSVLYTQLVDSGIITRLSRVPSAAVLQTRLEAASVEMSQQLEVIDDERRELEVLRRISEFARHLEDGLPCPLCGSHEHPHPLLGEDIDAKLHILQQRRRDVTMKQYLLNEKSKILVLLVERYRRASADLQELASVEEELDARLAAHDEAFAASEWTVEDRDAVVARYEEMRSLESLLRSLEERRRQIHFDLTQAQREYQRMMRDTERLSGDVRAHTKERGQLLRAVPLDVVEEFAGYDAQALYQRLGKERASTAAALKSRSGVEFALQRASAALAYARMRIHETDLRLEEARSDWDAVEKAIREALSEAGLSSIDAARDLMQSKRDIAKEQAELRSFFDEIAAVREKMHYAEEQMQREQHELPLDEVGDIALQLLRKERRAAHDALSSIHRELGTAESDLKRMGSLLDKKRQLEEDLVRVRDRHAAVSQSAKVFQGDGFFQYVAMQQLSKLCEEANRRFYKLTHNALMLEVDAEGDILVRDMQHDEELRSIRTLSGGQTFLASLCLALALSERVQKAIGIEQPFMFIDEGFGTLDTDSRIEVMEALLSLKKEKRTVGVISHSDEIKDLMPAYLHVVNTEERGSEIEVVLS